LAVAAVLLAWLGLMIYVWIWTRRDWGSGWALVGTVNVTFAALLALLVIWVVTSLVRAAGRAATTRSTSRGRGGPHGRRARRDGA
jgi:hypothetical protein